jgi:hypothetical protein
MSEKHPSCGECGVAGEEVKKLTTFSLFFKPQACKSLIYEYGAFFCSFPYYSSFLLSGKHFLLIIQSLLSHAEKKLKNFASRLLSVLNFSFSEAYNNQVVS